jgi:hypothetical protein
MKLYNWRYDMTTGEGETTRPFQFKGLTLQGQVCETNIEKSCLIVKAERLRSIHVAHEIGHT